MTSPSKTNENIIENAFRHYSELIEEGERKALDAINKVVSEGNPLDDESELELNRIYTKLIKRRMGLENG